MGVKSLKDFNGGGYGRRHRASSTAKKTGMTVKRAAENVGRYDRRGGWISIAF